MKPPPPSFRTRRRRLDVNLEEEPFSLLVNFFDISIVFALGFMLLALARAETSGAEMKADAAVPPEAVKLQHYRPTQEQLGGEGQRLGTAYRLPNGEVVYVPE